MGTEVDLQEFSRADRTRHREKVRRCLDVFARMLRESYFDIEDPMTGMEIEFNLVDDEGHPSLKSAEALEAIANPSFQTELAQFNLEINVLPRRLGSRGVSGFEDDLRTSLNNAESKANEVHAHMVMIGILPTLEDGHLSPSNVSPNPRYKLLSDQILAARGEDLVIDINGTERLRTTSESIMPEAACTSTQLHTQVSPDNFAAYWNASQAISGIQLAVGANSPYLLGKQLWQETRIPLFEQATDTRSEELKEQGVRPRVWFGERWINSIFDLFEENVRYFPALLPITDDEDPLQVLEDGGTPSLSELKLHNGTIYRWNRPVYDVVDGRAAPARREPRAGRRADGDRHDGQRRLLLRADPHPGRGRPAAVVADVVLGRRGELPRRPPSTASARASTGPASARCPRPSWCCVGCCRWRTRGSSAGASRPTRRTRLLEIIEQRCVLGRNGASWYVDRVTAHEEKGADRTEALRLTLQEYRELMHANEPVHTWPL